MTSDTKSTSRKTRLKFAARLVLALFLASMLGLNGEQRLALARILRDPLSIFADRSPGARPSGALTQTKAGRQAVLPKGENLLNDAHVFAPETLASGPQTDPTPNDSFNTSPPAPLGLADAGSPLTTGSHPVSGGKLPTRGGGVGGGGGGGGGPGDTTVPAIVVPHFDLPVPEPATWLTMLMGFTALGAALRWSKRKPDRAGDRIIPPARNQP